LITLLSTWTFGVALGFVALGVFVSYKLFSFPDITTDGSFTLGAVVATVLLVAGVDPALATLGGMLAGAVAGSFTGMLHAILGIEPLLSGILMTTALASINLVVLGRSNVPLSGVKTLLDRAETTLLPAARLLAFEGAAAGEAARLGFMLLAAAGAVLVLYLFFRTRLGTAMRAGGDTPTMARALGRNTGALTVSGLAIANSLTALSGAIVAQYQGFADVQMGIGMVVWGMASVYLGAALVGQVRLGGALLATFAGSVIFRQLVAAALRAGLDPDWLKFATAIVVLTALVAPRLLVRRHQASVAR
jgi:putative tryptophan/tyrosine transport system permease protein